MQADLDRRIKMTERNLERLRSSPNFPGAGTTSGEQWRTILILDTEDKLEELKRERNTDAGTGNMVHDEHAQAEH